MAAFTALDINLDNLVDDVANSGIVAAAASQTVDMTGRKKLTLYVRNADNDADAYVTIKAGVGIRSGLGSRIEKVDFGDTAVIKIEDTARHVGATGLITVELNQSNGSALGGGDLANITLIGIRE